MFELCKRMSSLALTIVNKAVMLPLAMNQFWSLLDRSFGYGLAAVMGPALILCLVLKLPLWVVACWGAAVALLIFGRTFYRWYILKENDDYVG